MSITYHCFVINNIIISKTDFIIIIPMIRFTKREGIYKLFINCKDVDKY